MGLYVLNMSLACPKDKTLEKDVYVWVYVTRWREMYVWVYDMLMEVESTSSKKSTSLKQWLNALL